jgi:hypothetical protein
VVATHQRVRVPFGRFHDVVQTFEWSRLEPPVIDRKRYARGIGVVEERSMSGDHETARLVSFTHGA